ncbi:MAG: hypothetical protein ABII85_02220 [Bacillota bacterium]
MGYQESFIYSKKGSNSDIKKAFEITKKYNINDISNTSIVGITKVKKDFSNNHKTKYPVLNWPKGTNLLFAAGERYDQMSIPRVFLIDVEEETQDISFTDEEKEFLLSNFEIVYIDDHVDSKLKGLFSDYFDIVE